MRRLPFACLLLGVAGSLVVAQPSSVWSRVQQAPPAAQAPAAASAPPGTVAPAAEFFRAADEVLHTMSRILDLPIVSPLKKSIRTRAQVRAYLVHEMQTDEDPAKRYADRRALEAFGLIPQGFPLDQFMLDLLTRQIAGLYDPKAKEFYIADWIPPAEQRIVMAHELTHALDDQHFHIEPWLKAARPNDDAELARDSVIEGSAVAAMIDYEMHSFGHGVADLPDIGPMVGMAVGDAAHSPGLEKAPPFIRDALVFPYFSGAVFTQQVLKAEGGWAGFRKVFARPPASTRQILHPQLYLENVAPVAVALPPLGKLLPRGWARLEENVLGEFGLEEVLKQFDDPAVAEKIAPGWRGDRYAVYEQQRSKRLLLVFLVRFAGADAASGFFSGYRRALERKYPGRRREFAGREFFRFATAEGGVFLRCRAGECLSVEGADRKTYDRIRRALRWPKASRLPKRRAARLGHALRVAQAFLPAPGWRSSPQALLPAPAGE
jgi:hypothetical protein